MATSREFETFLDDLFAPLGGVTRRRMFGGTGLYRDGLMFALVADDVLHFKVDPGSIPIFEAEGSAPFSYDTKEGRHTIASYWRAPERLYDEPDAFLVFARRAVEAAMAASAAKAAKRRPAGSGKARSRRAPA